MISVNREDRYGHVEVRVLVVDRWKATKSQEFRYCGDVVCSLVTSCFPIGRVTEQFDLDGFVA